MVQDTEIQFKTKIEQKLRPFKNERYTELREMAKQTGKLIKQDL